MSRYVFTNLARAQIGPIKCHRCGERIEIGDKVVSKKHGNRKFYHEECYESMFIEV